MGGWEQDGFGLEDGGGGDDGGDEYSAVGAEGGGGVRRRRLYQQRSLPSNTHSLSFDAARNINQK